MELQVVEKLENIGGDGQDVKFDFHAHEETIRTLEEQIIQVEKDNLSFKERMTQDTQKAIDICDQTRKDYIGRIKTIYEDHTVLIDTTKKLVAESKKALGKEIVQTRLEVTNLSKKLVDFQGKVKSEFEKELESL